MGRNQSRKAENCKNQSTSSPKERSSLPVTEQSWMENDFDESSEEGFRRLVITNFSELKEDVRTHHKEAKNLEKRVDKWLTRINSVENSLNDLMELKTMARELHDACTRFSSRFDQMEERVSVIEDQMNEMKREEKFREKRVKRNEQNLQDIWDYVKRPNLCLIGVPENDGEKGTKLENTLQDIIQENFPNLARQANIQIQEIQRMPQRYSLRRATPRHIIVRFTKVEIKEKMLRAAREKGRVTHKGKPIRLTVELLAETLQARKEWGSIFNILKEKNFQPRISYSAKLRFISEGEIKSFTNKQMLSDFVTTRPALQEILEEALNMERNNQYQPLQKHAK
uniref:LINE-1 retrotransposable element ORF1 protein n=1 Tax=Macaca fascicularis TaxID=9541 RepID=A0A7N9IDL6_MACFA